MSNSKIERAYFHSMEIEGIGCFKDKQILDLSNGNNGYAPWTLILGDNGMGKTTLLKLLVKTKKILTILKGYQYDTNNKVLSINFMNAKYYQSNINTHNNFQLTLTLIEDESLPTSIMIRNKVDISADYIKRFENIFLISYGASRRLGKTNNLFDINFESESLFDDSLELINAEEWYFQKYLNEQNSEKSVALIFAKQLEIIKKLLIDFLPDVSDLRPKAISDIKGTSSLEVKLEGGEWIPLRDLSYGYQTMTALLVDIGSRMLDKYPESDNPLAEPVIILIDEIDLHLHPKWQRQIMEQFSKYFPQAQFIVTSHSPLIVQAAKDINANIVVCRKEGDKVIIDNNPEEVKGWRIDQILISDLFDLPSIRSKADEEKMSRYYELQAKSELTNQEKSELEEIQKVMKKSFESDRPLSEMERKINQFLETHLK